MYPSHRKAHTHHYISHSGANCSSSKAQPTPTEHNTDRRKLIWKWFCCLPVHRTINPARTKPTSFSFGAYKHANSAFNVKHDNPPRHFSVALARDSARAIRSAAEVHHPSHVPSTACVCVCVSYSRVYTLACTNTKHWGAHRSHRWMVRWRRRQRRRWRQQHPKRHRRAAVIKHIFLPHH